MKLSEHRSVKEYYANQKSAPTVEPVTYGKICELCLESGADDVGIISIENEAACDQKSDILALFPKSRSIISLVCKMNKDNIRCPDRSVSDFEFLHGFEKMGNVSRRIVAGLEKYGVRAVNPSPGFPMDMAKWPGKMWPLSHKPLAAAAGLGIIGHHRMVIHPRFGSFIVLGTILIDYEPDHFDQALDYSPCLNCNICSTACPVGAISKDGHFNFANCMTHNYRDRVGGFSDWVENVVASKNARDYRQKVSDPESVSVWQSLSYGVCNKSSYCMAVCPAGIDVMGDYIEDRKQFKKSVVDPLKEKVETVYAVPGTDAEFHAKKKFPHKRVKLVGNGLRPDSAAGFLSALPLVFQRERAKNLDATFHFTFVGKENLQGTVDIRNGELSVQDGHIGSPDLQITADSDAWLKLLAKEGHVLRLLLTRKIKVKGPLKLMNRFANCFPS